MFSCINFNPDFDLLMHTATYVMNTYKDNISDFHVNYFKKQYATIKSYTHIYKNNFDNQDDHCNIHL